MGDWTMKRYHRNMQAVHTEPNSASIQEKNKKTTFPQALFLILLPLLFIGGMIESVSHIVYVPHKKVVEQYQILVHQSSDNLKLLYKPIPNRITHASKAGYDWENHINSLGFRGRECTVQKAPDTKRIIFLGDSVVYGYGLNEEETLPRQLERDYNRNGQKVEVLNLGVSGYETQQAVEFFKEIGLKFKPDIVVMGYTLNDSRYASMELDFFNDHAAWKVNTDSFPWEKKWMYVLYQHSFFLQYLDRERHLFETKPKIQAVIRGEKSIWHYIRDRNETQQDLANSEYRQLKDAILKATREKGISPEALKRMLEFVGMSDEVMQSSHWNVSKMAFAELKRLSEDNNFKVITLIFPYLENPSDYALASVHEFINKELNFMGVSTIDALEYTQKIYQKYGRAIANDPIHYSALGADLLAQYLRRELQVFGF